MKTRFLAGALVLSVAANLGFAIALFRERPVIAVNPLETGPESPEDEAVESARELAFLRELLTRASTYQSATYLQSQVNVLPLFSPALAEERKKEIQRVAKRMGEQNIVQEARLLRVVETAPHVFQTVTDVDLNENGARTLMKIEQKVETEREAPSLENAWGFRASSLATKMTKDDAFPSNIELRKSHPAVLDFPCAVRGVSELNPEQLKFKLVTTKNSELILQPKADWAGTIALQVECDRTVYDFNLRSGSASLRYSAVPMSAGRPIVRRAAGPSHPNRDQVKRSLERELGFQIEESDK